MYSSTFILKNLKKILCVMHYQKAIFSTVCEFHNIWIKRNEVRVFKLDELVIVKIEKENNS